jgi:hypothetical protein
VGRKVVLVVGCEGEIGAEVKMAEEMADVWG